MNTDVPTLCREIEEAALSLPAYEGGYNGKGIVICAGGSHHFTNAWVTIRMLRRVGSSLPIQLWYFGRQELDQRMEEMVSKYVVECVDALSIAEARGIRLTTPKQLPILAALLSPFEEILCLHADVIPTRSPDDLFECELYLETGAVFWPGAGQIGRGHPVWALMGIPYTNMQRIDFGQFVLHKELAWGPLTLAEWLNLRWDSLYDLLQSGKDLLQMAWMKYGAPFAMPAGAPQVLEAPNGSACCGIVCHHDFNKDVIFQHRMAAKWQLYGGNPWIVGFLFEPECRLFLDELRLHWNGRIGIQSNCLTRSELESVKQSLVSGTWMLLGWDSGPTAMKRWDPSQDSVVLECSLEDVRTSIPEWPRPPAESGRELDFNPNGSFGDSSTWDRMFWDVQTEANGFRLTIFGRWGLGAPTAALRRRDDGSWEGKQRFKGVPEVSVSLRCVQGGQAIPKRIGEILHIHNTSLHTGDQIVSLYACVGAVNAGWNVCFHTPSAKWLARVKHPGLVISNEPPPLNKSSASSVITIDLNWNRTLENRRGRTRAQWYAEAIGDNIIAARPASIESDLRMSRVGKMNFILAFPFSGWKSMEWPVSHWQRLIMILHRAGYEVIAAGSGSQSERLEEMFGPCGALWLVDPEGDWIIDAMLESSCVVSLDSAAGHLGGLLDVPTVAIHSQFPAPFLWTLTQVHGITPSTECASCRWQSNRGFELICEKGCSALATISPQTVANEVLGLIQASRSIA